MEKSFDFFVFEKSVVIVGGGIVTWLFIGLTVTHGGMNNMMSIVNDISTAVGPKN